MTLKGVIFGIAAGACALLGAEASAQTTLMMSSMSPGGSDNSQLFAAWGKRIADASKGTLKFDLKEGSTVASFVNVYERVQQDVLQIGWTGHPMYRAKWPMSEVAGLPFVQDDEYSASIALWRLYKTGMLDAEYKDLVPLGMALAGNTGLHFAKPPASLDDLGKYKVRVQGAAQTKMAEILGMSAQSIPAGDMYVALQRGTIDAALTSWSAFSPYKLWEVSTYHVEAPLGTTSFFWFMSRQKFDSLPAAAREAIEKNSGDAFVPELAKHFVAQAGSGRKSTEMHSAGHKIVKPSPEKLAQWEKSLGKPVIDDWLATTPNGDKILAKFKELYAQVKAGK